MAKTKLCSDNRSRRIFLADTSMGLTGLALGTLLPQRVMAADEKWVPPDGKPQLSESQLAVLRWWLDAGAPTDKTLGELKPTAEILTAIRAAIAPASVPTKAK